MLFPNKNTHFPILLKQDKKDLEDFRKRNNERDQYIGQELHYNSLYNSKKRLGDFHEHVTTLIHF